MTRHWCIFILLICWIALPAQAGETYKSDIGFSSSALVKSSFSAGRIGVEVYADIRVDVASLVAGLDFSKLESAQALADRVNEKRLLLYPDEEIIFSFTLPRQSIPADVPNKASLVRAIYWWNNTNCSTCYWYAQYTSAVATMFISDVSYGSYRIYDRVGSGNWVFRTNTSAGGSAARSTYGSKTLRGFRGDAARVSSKADIVMYFFN